ncbi:MAG: nucleotidyltransferase domain-containing protein [Thermodesulfobacteriota bacterium]
MKVAGRKKAPDNKRVNLTAGTAAALRRKLIGAVRLPVSPAHDSCSQGGIHTMINTKQDVFSILCQQHPRLTALGVRRIGLFGSFVRGEQHPESDIDILVEFVPEQKTFDNFMELSFFLEEILEHKIELVTIESLSPYLGPYILKEVEYAAIAA